MFGFVLLKNGLMVRRVLCCATLWAQQAEAEGSFKCGCCKNTNISFKFERGSWLFFLEFSFDLSSCVYPNCLAVHSHVNKLQMQLFKGLMQQKCKRYATKSLNFTTHMQGCVGTFLACSAGCVDVEQTWGRGNTGCKQHQSTGFIITPSAAKEHCPMCFGDKKMQKLLWFGQCKVKSVFGGKTLKAVCLFNKSLGSITSRQHHLGYGPRV